MKKEKAITLVALVLTIILMLILAGVTISIVTEGNILGQASEAVEQDRISKVQYELQEEIVKIATSGVREISMEKLIERLENKGVIVLGNTVNGQVITEEGYIFEIKLRAYRDIEVNYIGKGDLQEGTTLSLTPNTTGIASKVTITVKGVSTDGIKSYTSPTGTAKTYNNTPRTISETYEVTENGTYTFKITDSKNNEITENITITNVLAGTIQMSANKTAPTKDDVIVTITWPSNTGNGPKQVKVGEGAWQTVTGETSELTIKENCTIRAKVSNSIGEMVSASITVDNIDKTLPTISVGNTVTIDYKTDKEINEYFTIVANGTTDVTDIIYVDTSNGNASVENTNTLTIGTHIIQCIATKETGAISSATMTIVVEPGVFGNLYKISDTEYHLIFNGTGMIAKGYNETQLVVKGNNIRSGNSGEEIETGVFVSDEPWSAYSENITKVKIEEKIIPISTQYYFAGLAQISEIEGIENIETSKLMDINHMFAGCNNIIDIDVRDWNTGNVTNMLNVFCDCHNLESIDVSKWDTSNVVTMQGVFARCHNLQTIDVVNWNTASVENMWRDVCGM